MFVKYACLEVEPPDYVLSESIPSREIMLLNEKIKACHIQITSHMLDVTTLLVLRMHDFDVILGINWLVTNHASIDCSRNEVNFNPRVETSFKYKEVGTVVLHKLILTMKTNKLLNQDTLSILIRVVDIGEDKVFLTSEQVVRDYLDVCTEELSILSPHREIDFAIIVLELGIVLISKALSKIVLTKLKEFEVQLQELLDKDFIRLSVSP